MMTLVEKGDDYRIFKDKLLFLPFYVLEDSRKAVQMYMNTQVKSVVRNGKN